VRWFWIDRFEEFVSGQHASAVKAVALVEEELDDYTPGYPVLPASLIIEGLAQTSGLLVGEISGFRERVVLAKVSKAKFYFEARPGDTLHYKTIIEDIGHDGAIASGTSHLDGKLQAKLELVFAYLDERFDGVDLFYPSQFLTMLRLLRIYDVGRTPEGDPLVVPPHLLEAELLANGYQSPSG